MLEVTFRRIVSVLAKASSTTWDERYRNSKNNRNGVTKSDGMEKAESLK